MDNITVGTAAVSLNDYIIDMDGAKQRPAVTYEIMLENNTDFIVRRQTQKLQKELVILVSQGLYYIRDCKTGTIDPVTNRSLRTFLRDLKDDALALEQVYWLNALYRESADFISTVTEDAVLSDMCRHNVPIDFTEPGKHKKFWEQNKKLFVRLMRIFPPRMAGDMKYQYCLPVIFWIEEHYGTNEAVYFAEQVVQSGVRRMVFSGPGSYHYTPTHDISSFTAVLQSDYNINLRRFTEYLCFDL